MTAPALESGRDARAGGFSRACAFVVALSVSLVLQFAAVGKILGPNPKVFLLQPGEYGLKSGLLLDYAAAAGELVFVLLLMAWHGRKFVWPLVSMMFAGFAGYSLYWTIRNESCGCFGVLWTPPLGVTLALDIGLALIALMVAGGLRLSKGLIVLVLLLNGGLTYVGYCFAQHNAPPLKTVESGKTGQDRLLASELMKDIRDQPAGGPAWYVFVFDPTCHICEQMKPFVEQYQQQSDAGDPNLRVRQFAIPDLKAKLGIDEFEWFPTPTVFIVKDGAILKVWRGEECLTKLPDQELAMKLASGQPL